MDARSPRIPDIADAMDGNYEAKVIQRFIEEDKINVAMHRLYNEESEYVDFAGELQELMVTCFQDSLGL